LDVPAYTAVSLTHYALLQLLFLANRTPPLKQQYGRTSTRAVLLLPLFSLPSLELFAMFFWLVLMWTNVQRPGRKKPILPRSSLIFRGFHTKTKKVTETGLV